MNSPQVIITSAARSDGVGDALRSAFRGRMKHLPPDMEALLAKLDF